VVVHLPWPLAHPGEVVERVLAACGPRTRLALLDHVTSPTGMVLPIRTLVAELDNRGIDTLVDGAHAPGMLPLALDRLGAAFYTGNCHKWLCAPKGAAFLWARADRRERLRPLVVSHGANRRRPGRSRLHDEFDWQGTEDVSAFLCVPVALDFLDGLLAGGLGALMRDNRERALTLRARLADVLGVEAPCPDEMIGALVALPLPDGPPGLGPFETDPLQQRLLEAHRIEIPVSPFPASPRRVLRASVQIYNTEDDFGRLAAALASEGLGAG